MTISPGELEIESTHLATSIWSDPLTEFFCGSVLLLGGILTVSVLLITEASLTAVTIWYVLIPGTAVGLMLMMVGGIGLTRCQKAAERR